MRRKRAAASSSGGAAGVGQQLQEVWEFAPAHVPDGISLRNFGIQMVCVIHFCVCVGFLLMVFIMTNFDDLIRLSPIQPRSHMHMYTLGRSLFVN